MSILDSIKGERKMSFDHWRYRLLHWTFNVKNPSPDNIHKTGLPPFLYSHYCPLFHLTNIIFLALPAIVFVKLIVLLFCSLAKLVELLPLEKIFKFFRSKFPTTAMKDLLSEKCLRSERKLFIQWLSDCNISFEDQWNIYGTLFKFLQEEEAKALYDEYVPKYKAAREELERRKAARRAYITFWINFSRDIIKWGLNIGYIVLAAVLMYVIYISIEPVWSCFCGVCSFIYWVFTHDGFWEVVRFALGVILMFVTLAGFGILVIETELGEKVVVVGGKVTLFLITPLSVLLVPFRWFRKCVGEVAEFLAMFYEENCPPIVLISTEEAVVESVVQNGEEV